MPTEAQRIRAAGFQESIRVRGRKCFLLPERSEFRALVSPIGVEDGVFDDTRSNPHRLHVPADSVPSRGIKVGNEVLEEESGDLHRVTRLHSADRSTVFAFDCETTPGA